MTTQPNPLATEHLPFFITPPGGTDVLYNITLVLVVLSVVGLGVIFFTIHSLPERIAHKTKKVQLDIVAILLLISLFTNEHIFWVAALLLAFINFPDFMTPVRRIANAVEDIAGLEAEGELASGIGTAKSVATESAHAPGETSSKRVEIIDTPRRGRPCRRATTSFPKVIVADLDKWKMAEWHGPL
jgi:hypothetical protein